MQEVRGDLWTFNPVSEPLVVRCITTNGFVKANGRAVMGRGCAFQASKLMPTLPLAVGTHIQENGNTVMGPLKLFGLEGRFIGNSKAYQILTFPVKHNWWEKADIHLIRASAEKLRLIAKVRKELVFVLPRPGCGNGQLEWPNVKQWLKDLPDSVYVITNE